MRAAARRTVGTALGLGLLGGCAAADPGWGTAVAQFAFAPNVDEAFAPATLSAALPHTVYALADGSERRVSDAVVLGEFVSSEPARAMNWDSGQEVEWSDDEAQTRTVTARFAVEEVISTADGVDVPGEIDVFVTVHADADADAVGEGLVGAEKSVALLREHWDPHFDDGWAIAQSGSLVMTVSDDGDLDLPVHAATDQHHLEQDLTTLSALRATADDPDTVIEVE